MHECMNVCKMIFLFTLYKDNWRGKRCGENGEKQTRGKNYRRERVLKNMVGPCCNLSFTGRDLMGEMLYVREGKG